MAPKIAFSKETQAFDISSFANESRKIIFDFNTNR